jgi:hypothetical protein
LPLTSVRIVEATIKEISGADKGKMGQRLRKITERPTKPIDAFLTARIEVRHGFPFGCWHRSGRIELA